MKDTFTLLTASNILVAIYKACARAIAKASCTRRSYMVLEMHGRILNFARQGKMVLRGWVGEPHGMRTPTSSENRI
jgi:hypothetical protein